MSRATRLAALERGLPSGLDSWRLAAMRFIRLSLANAAAPLPSPPPTDQHWADSLWGLVCAVHDRSQEARR